MVKIASRSISHSEEPPPPNSSTRDGRGSCESTYATTLYGHQGIRRSNGPAVRSRSHRGTLLISLGCLARYPMVLATRWEAVETDMQASITNVAANFASSAAQRCVPPHIAGCRQRPPAARSRRASQSLPGAIGHRRRRISHVEGAISEVQSVRLPPRPPIPKWAQTIAFVLSQRWTVGQIARRLGTSAYVFGRIVVICDPALAKEAFTTKPQDLGNFESNLSEAFGPGSVFGQEGIEHRHRRKLLAPPFHGKALQTYASLIEEETLREIARWPSDTEFETLAPMNRLTLNIILRAVMGQEIAEIDRLRAVIPAMVTLGSRLWSLPIPRLGPGKLNPWHRYDAYRSEFDRIVGAQIDRASRDPNLDERTDVLAILLRSTYADGRPMPARDIADEILTLLAAGHETTSSALSWAFERITRHPHVLDELEREERGDDNELRTATIQETLRLKPVVVSAARTVFAPVLQLGEWRIPRGYSLIVSIEHIHQDPQAFPDPTSFDPFRFTGQQSVPPAWIPFGGGSRRCVGALLANLEMDVVLRTVFRNVTVHATDHPREKTRWRGIAPQPAKGGRIRISRPAIAADS
jgi:cytochrome P450